MCKLCSIETGISDETLAHNYVKSLQLRAMASQLSNPLMISGVMFVFSNRTDDFIRVDNWQGLAQVLDSLTEED